MSLEARISQDLKAAMLAGQKQQVETLRGLKSVLLYAKVADKLVRDNELQDDAVISLLAKESKKRQESADLYVQGGNQQKADDELAEKQIIDAYLPKQLSDQELAALVNEVIAQLGDGANMGQVIGVVKQKAGATADGGKIAGIVKERLS